MALNAQQTTGLDALNKKIAWGYKPNQADTANLNFGKSQGYKYQVSPVTNVPVNQNNTPMITGYKDGVAVQVPKGAYVPGVSLTPPPKINAGTTDTSKINGNLNKALSANEQLLKDQTTAGETASNDTYSTTIKDLADQIKQATPTYNAETATVNKQNLLAKQAEERTLKESYQAGTDLTGQQPGVPMSDVRGQQADIEKQYLRQSGVLSDQEANLLSQVNLDSQDRADVISGAKTLVDIQDKLQSHIDTAKKDVLDQANTLSTTARANLTTALSNLVGVDPDKMTAEQTAQLTQLAQQAGYPAELLFSGMRAVNLQQTLDNNTKNKDYGIIGEHVDQESGQMVNDYGFINKVTGEITTTTGQKYTGGTTGTTDTTGTATNSIDAFKKSITTQESGNYSAVNKDSGALGAYQMMPDKISLVGLNPASATDRQKFLNTPALQDQSFAKFVDGLSQKYGGDTTKMAAAYYGGAGGASVVGTEAGNRRQGANGEYPSINEYVKSVGDRMNNLMGASNNNEIPPQYEEALSNRTPEQIAAFNSLKEMDKSDVAMLITGDAQLDDLLKSRGVAGNAARQALVNKARKVDPNFSITENKQRVTFKSQWNNINGGGSKTIVSANTSLGHIATLKTLTDQLQNTDFMKANSISQAISKNVNGPQGAIVSQVDQTIELMAHELASFYAGGTAPDIQSIQNQRAILNASKPSDIISSLINNQTELLGSKVSQLGRQYYKVMGGYPVESVLDPEVLSKLKTAGVDTSALETEYYNQQNYVVGKTYTVYGKQVKYNGNGDFTPLN